MNRKYSDFWCLILPLVSKSYCATLLLHSDILEGYDTIGRGNRALSAQIDALTDMKFTYVLSCQSFGAQKAAGDPRAKDIIDLMIR